MAIKKFTTFNGKEWVEIIAEEQYINARPTGHYKEIERKYLSSNGIIDDDKINSDMIDFINKFAKDNPSEFYTLSSFDENTIIYSQNEKTYPTLGEVVSATFKSYHGCLIEKYYLDNQKIAFDVYIRQKQLQTTMYLQLSKAFDSIDFPDSPLISEFDLEEILKLVNQALELFGHGEINKKE